MQASTIIRADKTDLGHCLLNLLARRDIRPFADDLCLMSHKITPNFKKAEKYNPAVSEQEEI